MGVRPQKIFTGCFSKTGSFVGQTLPNQARLAVQQTQRISLPLSQLLKLQVCTAISNFFFTQYLEIGTQVFKFAWMHFTDSLHVQSSYFMNTNILDLSSYSSTLVLGTILYGGVYFCRHQQQHLHEEIEKLVIKQVTLGDSTSNLEGQDLNSSRLRWVIPELSLRCPLSDSLSPTNFSPLCIGFNH